MDKLRRVLSGRDENEEVGLTSQVQQENVCLFAVCLRL